jgi:hypothetical protein
MTITDGRAPMGSANGFISHVGGPSPGGGMRIIEILGVRGRQPQVLQRKPGADPPAWS